MDSLIGKEHQIAPGPIGIMVFFPRVSLPVISTRESFGGDLKHRSALEPVQADRKVGAADPWARLLLANLSIG
jgi:hypothetical protein